LVWWSGHTIEASIDANVSIGDLVFLDPTVPDWRLSDFTSARGSQMLGIKVGDTKVLLDGHVVVTNSSIATNWPLVNGQTIGNIGSPIYGDPANNGQMTTTVPSTTGDYVRLLGHCYNYESGERYYIMFFRPSNDWLVI